MNYLMVLLHSLRIWIAPDQSAWLSLCKLLLELQQLVLELPHLLVSQVLGLCVLLQLGLDVLDCLLGVLLAQCLFNLNLVASTIINEVCPGCCLLLLTLGCLGLTLDAKVTAL